MWQKQAKRKKEREESGQRKRMEMIRQAEDEQLARKTCFDEAVQNTDSKMFCDSDFNLPSGTRASEITKAHARSSAITRSMAALKMESTRKQGIGKIFHRFLYAAAESILMRELFGVLPSVWLTIKLVARMSLV